jgi:hypothetical protein
VRRPIDLTNFFLMVRLFGDLQQKELKESLRLLNLITVRWILYGKKLLRISVSLTYTSEKIILMKGLTSLALVF